MIKPKLQLRKSIGIQQSGGKTKFTELTDTPNSYTGEQGKVVSVNEAGDGLEFTEASEDVVWGNITGTLSNQADLQTALNEKSNTNHTHTESDITDLDKYTQSETDTLLDGKANTTHTHGESDITDLDKYTKAEVDGLLEDVSGTPEGDDGSIQYNNNGSFGGGRIEYSENTDDTHLRHTGNGNFILDSTNGKSNVILHDDAILAYSENTAGDEYDFFEMNPSNANHPQQFWSSRNKYSFANDNGGKFAILKTDDITEDRELQLPDKDGTLATTDDVGGGGGQLYEAIVAPSDGDYTTLGAAITGGAKNIFIRAGSYTESAINTSVTDLTIIGESRNNVVLGFSSNDATFSGAGLSIRNCGFDFTTGGLTISGNDGLFANNRVDKAGGSGTSKILHTSGQRSIFSGNIFVSSNTSSSGSPFDFNTAYGVVEGNVFFVNANVANGTVQCRGASLTFSNNTVRRNSSGNQYLLRIVGCLGSGNTIDCSGRSCNGVNLGGSAVFTGNRINEPNIAVFVLSNGLLAEFSSNNIIFCNKGITFLNTASADNMIISGNKIRGNGTTAGNIGVDILNNTGNMMILNNAITNFNIGVNIPAAGINNTHVLQNNLIGNTTAISDSGTSTVTGNNIT